MPPIPRNPNSARILFGHIVSMTSLPMPPDKKYWEIAIAAHQFSYTRAHATHRNTVVIILRFRLLPHIKKLSIHNKKSHPVTQIKQLRSRGLCEVRRPLHPRSPSVIPIGVQAARTLIAAPRHPRSWWFANASDFNRFAIQQNPFSESKTKLRIPKGVS
jgi:hypothetical protein